MDTGVNIVLNNGKSEIELKDGSMIICKGTGQQLEVLK